MRQVFIPYTLFFLLLSFQARSQETGSKFEVNGYLSNMQSVMFTDIEKEWVNENLFHNRINLFWYPSPSFTGSIQFRNRFLYGDMLQFFPGYAESIGRDNSYLDLSLNIVDEKSFLLNSTIDRLYLQYSSGNFVATAGRQRINWALNYVWNPNDIFNVQNYFDFDYIEKPGSDALRLQYYTGFASILEVAAKVGHDSTLTAAAYYRFNRWNYDFQFLGGIFSESDYVVGTGWSGDIEGAGFRGEITYLHPVENFSDTTGILYTGISADYTFKNSLNIQLEGLYSRFPENYQPAGFFNYYQGAVDLKRISFSEFSIFSSLSYPFTPLFTGTLAGIYFSDQDAYYLGPSLDYSLKENLQLSLIFQWFSGKFPDPLTMENRRQEITFAFLRYKYSF